MNEGIKGATSVHNTQQRQGASNVTIRNIITSMRLISDLDWADLFESVSLVDERLSAASAFADMDFPTRNLYRSAIEQLARGSSRTELKVTHAAAYDALNSATSSTERIPFPGAVMCDRINRPHI